ncbi:hypothetical protein [Solimonas soli]|uniref:hypothetical protein n=1 Tax=Solimonas soli TaxID=413479 RepID=UPI000481C1BD|nr:hypothetical protein [Solimonas soli]
MPERAASRRLARAISLVAHPFVVPAASALWATLRRGAAPAELLLLAALLGVLVTAVAAYSWQRVRSGRWQDIDASRRAERRELNRFAFVLVGAAALFVIVVLRRPIFGLPLATAAAMLLVCLVTGRWLKLSHHVMFAVLPAGWLWPDGRALLAIAVLAAAVGWSRRRLGRHDLPEIVGGAALGAFGAAVVACGLD